MEIGCNPWFKIWVNPRITIQKIVDHNSNYRLGILCAIYGFVSLLGISQSFSLGDRLNFILIIVLSIILSAIWGYIVLSISSFFMYFTGKWFKGTAKFSELRAAAAWSNVPMTINVILWIVLLILYKGSIFNQFNKAIQFTTINTSILFSFTIAQLILSIWSLVIYISCITQLQKFSVLRAVLNIIVASIIVIVIVFIVTFLINWIVHFFSG